MKPKISMWVTVAMLTLGILVWAPKVFHHKTSKGPKTAKEHQQAFQTVWSEALKLAEKPDADERMLAWVATTLKVDPAQLHQECQQYKLRAPEIFVLYRVRPKGSTLLTIEDVMGIYDTEKDWYKVIMKRGYYPSLYVSELEKMIQAGNGK